MKQCITRLLKEHQKNEAFHPLWIELQFPKQSNIICGVINFYRQHNSVDRFLDYFEEAVDRYSATRKPICLLGDVNINILLAQTCNYAQRFLDCLQSYALLPTIDKPTRVYNNSATVIDNIFTNTFCEYFASGNIVFDITDHFSQFCIFQSSIETTQPTKLLFETTQNTLSRDFYRIFHNYIGNLFFLGEMWTSYSLLSIRS